MTEKIKSSKGDTDVRRDDSTYLHTPNMIDLSQAEIAEGKKGEWDDFQLFGDSDAHESMYHQGENSVVDEAVLKRIRDRSIGRKIKRLKLDLA